MPKPSRGDIWMADLDPTCGHATGGSRSGLVISADTFNAWTGRAGHHSADSPPQQKGVRSHVPVHSARGRASQAGLH